MPINPCFTMFYTYSSNRRPETLLLNEALSQDFWMLGMGMFLQKKKPFKSLSNPLHSTVRIQKPRLHECSVGGRRGRARPMGARKLLQLRQQTSGCDRGTSLFFSASSRRFTGRVVSNSGFLFLKNHVMSKGKAPSGAIPVQDTSFISLSPLKPHIPSAQTPHRPARSQTSLKGHPALKAGQAPYASSP